MAGTQEINSLAQQLRASGIAFTELDAKRMAEEMLGTSSKVYPNAPSYKQHAVSSHTTPTQSTDSALRQEFEHIKQTIAQHAEHIAQLKAHNTQLQQQLDALRMQSVSASVASEDIQETASEEPSTSFAVQEDILQSDVPLQELLDESPKEVQHEASFDMPQQEVAFAQQDNKETQHTSTSPQQASEDILQESASVVPEEQQQEKKTEHNEFDLSDIFNVNK